MTTWKSLFRFIATITSHALTTRAIWIACLCFFPAFIFSQTDEIQVYDGEIAAPGILNLMIHNNFTPKGRKTPDYPGAIIANDSYQVTGEWAYGVKPWMEQGLYMPVTSLYSTNHGTTFNGFKIRELFVRPNAHDHTFFYAANFEFSFNQKQWDPRKHTSEIRPIIGWHLKPIDIIVNPILDNSYLHGLKGLDFAPAGRVAYNFNEEWALAAEEYADFGTLRDFQGASTEMHEAWAVVDHKGKTYNVETGIGFGLTSVSDKVTLKLMISRDLN